MKEKTLINDSRLTPTMRRTRSGSTQRFREKSAKDDDVIVLEHENKEMYAELIDGEWYWVSGCAECIGKPRDWVTYIECDKHDRCSSCGINRKDLKGSVWGGKKGWTCKPCKEAKDLEIRAAAFEALDGEEPDCTYMDEVICPHCGSKTGSDVYESDDDMECHVCEGEFSLDVQVTLDYSTTIKGTRITE